MFRTFLSLLGITVSTVKSSARIYTVEELRAMPIGTKVIHPTLGEGTIQESDDTLKRCSPLSVSFRQDKVLLMSNSPPWNVPMVVVPFHVPEQPMVIEQHRLYTIEELRALKLRTKNASLADLPTQPTKVEAPKTKCLTCHPNQEKPALFKETPPCLYTIEELRALPIGTTIIHPDTSVGVVRGREESKESHVKVHPAHVRWEKGPQSGIATFDTATAHPWNAPLIIVKKDESIPLRPSGRFH